MNINEIKQVTLEVPSAYALSEGNYNVSDDFQGLVSALGCAEGVLRRCGYPASTIIVGDLRRQVAQIVKDNTPKPVAVGLKVQTKHSVKNSGRLTGTVKYIDPSAKLALVERDEPLVESSYDKEFGGIGKDGRLKFFTRHLDNLEVI